MATDLVSVDNRHHDVEQDQVEARLLEQGQRLSAVLGLGHRKAGVAQRAGRHAAHQRIVIDNQ